MIKNWAANFPPNLFETCKKLGLSSDVASSSIDFFRVTQMSSWNVGSTGPKSLPTSPESGQLQLAACILLSVMKYRNTPRLPGLLEVLVACNVSASEALNYLNVDYLRFLSAPKEISNCIHSTKYKLCKCNFFFHKFIVHWNESVQLECQITNSSFSCKQAIDFQSKAKSSLSNIKQLSPLIAWSYFLLCSDYLSNHVSNSKQQHDLVLIELDLLAIVVTSIVHWVDGCITESNSYYASNNDNPIDVIPMIPCLDVGLSNLLFAATAISTTTQPLMAKRKSVSCQENPSQSYSSSSQSSSQQQDIDLDIPLTGWTRTSSSLSHMSLSRIYDIMMECLNHVGLSDYGLYLNNFNITDDNKNKTSNMMMMVTRTTSTNSKHRKTKKRKRCDLSFNSYSESFISFSSHLNNARYNQLNRRNGLMFDGSDLLSSDDGFRLILTGETKRENAMELLMTTSRLLSCDEQHVSPILTSDACSQLYNTAMNYLSSDNDLSNNMSFQLAIHYHCVVLMLVMSKCPLADYDIKLFKCNSFSCMDYLITKRRFFMFCRHFLTNIPIDVHGVSLLDQYKKMSVCIEGKICIKHLWASPTSHLLMSVVYKSILHVACIRLNRLWSNLTIITSTINRDISWFLLKTSLMRHEGLMYNGSTIDSLIICCLYSVFKLIRLHMSINDIVKAYSYMVQADHDRNDYYDISVRNISTRLYGKIDLVKYFNQVYLPVMKPFVLMTSQWTEQGVAASTADDCVSRWTRDNNDQSLISSIALNDVNTRLESFSQFLPGQLEKMPTLDELELERFVYMKIGNITVTFGKNVEPELLRRRIRVQFVTLYDERSTFRHMKNVIMEMS